MEGRGLFPVFGGLEMWEIVRKGGRGESRPHYVPCFVSHQFRWDFVREERLEKFNFSSSTFTFPNFTKIIKHHILPTNFHVSLQFFPPTQPCTSDSHPHSIFPPSLLPPLHREHYIESTPGKFMKKSSPSFLWTRLYIQIIHCWFVYVLPHLFLLLSHLDGQWGCQISSTKMLPSHFCERNLCIPLVHCWFWYLLAIKPNILHVHTRLILLLSLSVCLLSY